MKDQVFTIRHNGGQVWQCYLSGKVLPTTWNSRGAALAGLEVESRRQKSREVNEG